MLLPKPLLVPAIALSGLIALVAVPAPDLLGLALGVLCLNILAAVGAAILISRLYDRVAPALTRRFARPEQDLHERSGVARRRRR